MTNSNPDFNSEEVVLTEAELAQYAEQLKDFPDAQEALDLIKESNGNLLGAAEKYAEMYPEEVEKLFQSIDSYSAQKQEKNSQ
jgi:hypothetical protein